MRKDDCREGEDRGRGRRGCFRVLSWHLLVIDVVVAVVAVVVEARVVLLRSRTRAAGERNIVMDDGSPGG